MTNQELFNTVAKHLLTQNEKSCNEFQTCMYRGLKGLKCAAGILIPDSEYKPSFEGKDIKEFEIRIAAGLSDENGFKQVQLARDLQITHDANLVENWKYALNEIAEEWHLNTEVLNGY